MLILLAALGCIAPPQDSWFLTFSQTDSQPSDGARFVWSDGAALVAEGIALPTGDLIELDTVGVEVTANGSLVRFGSQTWEWSDDRGQTWEDVTPDLDGLTWNSRVIGRGKLVLYTEDEPQSGRWRIQLSNERGRSWSSGTVKLPAGSSIYEFSDDRAMATDPEPGPGGAGTIYTFSLPGGSPKRLVADTRAWRSATPPSYLPDGTGYWPNAQSQGPDWYDYEILNMTVAPGWSPGSSSYDFPRVRKLGEGPDRVSFVDEEGHAWSIQDDQTWRSDQPIASNQGLLHERLQGPRCRQKLWPDLDPHLEATEGGGQLVITNDSDKPIVPRLAPAFEPAGPAIAPGVGGVLQVDLGDIVYAETTDGYCYGFWLIEGNDPHITVATP